MKIVYPQLLKKNGFLHFMHCERMGNNTHVSVKHCTSKEVNLFRSDSPGATGSDQLAFCKEVTQMKRQHFFTVDS